MPLSSAAATLIGTLGSAAIGSAASGVSSGKLNRATRNFNHREAELARQWQEDFYNKYQSPSAMVQQYRDAGLNPALMYARGSVTPSPASSSPANAGQVVSPDFSQLNTLGPQILQIADMLKNNKAHRDTEKALQNKYNADAELARSQKTGQDIQNEFSPKQFELNLKQGELNLQNLEKGLNLLDEKIANLQSDTLNNYGSFRNYIASANLSDTTRSKVLAEIKKIGEETTLLKIQQGLEELKKIAVNEQANRDNSQAALMDEQRLKEQWLNSYIDKHNMSPEFANSLWSLFMQALTSSLEGPEARSFNIN